MKFRIILFLFAFSMLGCSSNDDSQPDPQPVQTVVYLIRHAEKADSSADPDLSPGGLQRAESWALLLEDITFEAFYSTDYNRTRQTIAPIAASNGKDVQIYNPWGFTLEQVVLAYPGKNVFIVGHSNTIPQLINDYIGSDVYPDMAENEFGNLYKITVIDGQIWHQKTVHN